MLEPTAGTGELAEMILRPYAHESDWARHHRPRVYCVEIHPERQAVLQAKGLTLVGSDIFQYKPLVKLTHVIMNPPFLRCEDILLYVWEMLQSGFIGCILPQTLREGRTSKEQEIIALVERHGEFEDAGRAFAKDAERYMGKEVTIARLEKKANAQFAFDFEPVNDRDFASPPTDEATEVGLTGYIAPLLAAYDATLAMYGEYNRLRQQLLRYSKPLVEYHRMRKDERGNTRGENISVIQIIDDIKDETERFNTFIELLTQGAWMRVLNHPSFHKIMTVRTETALQEYRERQHRVDFNHENIERFLREIAGREQELLIGAVLDSFEEMTKHSPESREAPPDERWKSNDCYVVNKRVVLPGFLNPIGPGWRSSYFGIAENHSRKLDDIDRGLCQVANVRFESIVTIQKALDLAFNGPPGNRHSLKNPGYTQSTFFKIRYFKKGTLHLYWLDEDLRQAFNIRASQGKKWLPPDTNDSRTTRPAKSTAQPVTGQELALIPSYESLFDEDDNGDDA
ncbi:MAG: DUF4942 domain-containing protein [Xanthomonadales bacterium]|nr:DUF4942 domain-containing protein [Xanthomonadales bacterium]